MSKFSSIYVCQQCGFRSSQFLGKCPECGTWNSLVESVEEVQRVKGKVPRENKKAEIVNLNDLETANFERISTGIGEFDRVLGNGIVRGSVILVCGDPGIGKSTLLLQLALQVHGSWFMVHGKDKNQQTTNNELRTDNQRGALYVAGEESAQQIKIRADRVVKGANLAILNETDVDVICETIRQLGNGSKVRVEKPVWMEGKEDSVNTNFLTPKPSRLPNPNPISLVIIDSIQTMETSDLSGVAGSVGQVRECAHRLQRMAKRLHVPIFLVGHVTKDGSIAGPKTLEHLVDVVLSLEGDPASNFRILRSSKNRFGSVDEVGIFEMEECGMVEVKNPSKLFLDSGSRRTPGSAVVATMNGQRVILVEIQALVSKSFLPVPRRVGLGVDNNKLQLLSAVLCKRLGLPLFDKDIFINVTGGLKILEPAADLAICTAIISSLKDVPIAPKTILIGEVGLLGEIRGIRGMEKRIKEAKKLGFTKIISPENAQSLSQAVKLALE